MRKNNDRPPVRRVHDISLPMARTTTAANGVGIHSLDYPDQEVVRVSFVFGAGSALQDKAFTASSTANMLSEGTARYTAHQIAEMLDYHGSYFDVSLDRDYAVVNFVSLLRFFDRTMEIAREIVLHPAFPSDEVAIYRAKRRQRLALERSRVATRCRDLFGEALFSKDHPYGIWSDEALYDQLTREDLAEFYARHYTAANCFVVCSGRVGENELRQVEELAASIPAGVPGGGAPFPAPRSRRTAFLPHPDALQSSVRIGTLLFPRTHPDFIAMQVAATVLGGYFGSRLVRNLREEHGYTYGVFAAMVNMEHAGYLAISTEVAADATPDAVAQIFGETERLRSEPVPPAELDMVKSIMTGEVMRILDGPFGVADVTIENIQCRTDNSYMRRFIDTVDGITPPDLLAAVQRHLDPARFTTAVVGEPSLGKQFDK